MSLMIAGEQLPAPFGNFSMGTVICSCLIVAFIISAVLCTLNYVRTTRGRLKLLDEDTRARKALDEELATIGSKPSRVKQLRDPWGER